MSISFDPTAAVPNYMTGYIQTPPASMPVWSGTVTVTPHPEYSNILDKLKRIEKLMSNGEWKGKICTICGQEPEYFGVVMGYGSTHDEEVVCGECLSKFLDPIIDAVHAAS